MKAFPFSPSLALAAALLVAPLGFSQIASSEYSGLIDSLEGRDFDARYAARMSLQDHVSQASAPGNAEQMAAVEAQILDTLKTEVADTTKVWLMRQLCSIGSDASIDTLSSLLATASYPVADMARMTLEVNPSPRATDVLVKRLGMEKNPRQIIGLLNSLAQRDAASAANAFAKQLNNADADVAAHAAMLLGEIEADSARETLADAKEGAPSVVGQSIELALVDSETDIAHLSTLAQGASNPSLRVAAFKRVLALNIKKANTLLGEILAADSDESAEAFLRAALDTGNRAIEKTVLTQLASLTAGEQEAVLGTFKGKPSKKLENLALELAKSGNEQLTLQAIEALGRIGSINSLPFLLETLGSRDRDLRETAAYAISSINDKRIDRDLLKAAASGENDTRILALSALRFRPGDKALALAESIAGNCELDTKLREAALDAIEQIGTTGSFKLLVDLIVSADDKIILKSAQSTIKRLTLRAEDPEAAWNAFQAGLETAKGDPAATNALLRVLDSASSPQAIAYLEEAWQSGNAGIQETILRVLPIWRNWDGGYALLDIATSENATPELKDKCFAAIGRLILGSDMSYSFDGKFQLAAAALENADTAAQRTDVINGFRYSTWRERIHVTYNEVDPDLKEAVLKFAIN